MSISSSTSSVETLFMWGGKHLHNSVANLFRKLCPKFHHNCPSFIGDITKNILVSFSRTQCIAISIRSLWSFADFRPFYSASKSNQHVYSIASNNEILKAAHHYWQCERGWVHPEAERSVFCLSPCPLSGPQCDVAACWSPPPSQTAVSAADRSSLEALPLL